MESEKLIKTAIGTMVARINGVHGEEGDPSSEAPVIVHTCYFLMKPKHVALFQAFVQLLHNLSILC